MTDAFDDLIVRLEAATGPDPHLDAEIEAALRGGEPAYRSASRHQFGPSVVLNHGAGNPWDGWESAPSFTGSLDAALPLVPKGWWAEVYARPDQPSCRLFEFCMPCRKVPDTPHVIFGANTAIAVCIAALCALRLSPRGPGGGR